MVAAQHAGVSEPSPQTTDSPDGGGKPQVPPPAAAPPAADTTPASSPPSGNAPSSETAGSAAPAGGETASALDGAKKRKRRRRKRKAADSPAGGEAAPPARAAGPREGKPRRRRRRDSGPSEHHAMTAIRSLSAMAEGLLQIEGIDFLSKPRFMDIEVRIPLDPGRDGAKAASEVMERILRRVKEVRDHDRALVPGSVYCYYAETAESHASRPKELREVFDGYSSTGRPEFTDFVTMAIERKQEGIDELLAGEDLVITHVSIGRALRTAQLAEFGKSSPIYRILGQVDAGLFPVMNSSKKAAFSFQLLRGTTLEGRPRLRIHPVGAADVMDLADPSVAQILSRFQRRLDQDSLRLAGKLANDEQLDEEEFVLPLLQELAKQLSGRARRKNRRTKHADQRTEEGQRPTTKAYDDAEAAHDDHLLWDDRENTAVIVGPRGRVHVFTPDAKHVTSLVMQGSNIQKRKQQHHWRPAEPEERGEFRIALRRRRGRGEDVVASDEVTAAPPAPAAEAPAPVTETPAPAAEPPAAEVPPAEAPAPEPPRTETPPPGESSS